MDSGDTSTFEVASSWYEFSQETSMHGLKQTTVKHISLARRLVWVFLVLFFVGFWIYSAQLFLTDYVNKLVITKVKVKNAQNLTFPTVTICNRNYWKKSEVEHDHESPEETELLIQWLLDMFSPDGESPPSPGRYNWSSALWRDRHMEVMMPESYMIPLFSSLAHKFNDTFLYCFVQGKPVTCRDIFVDVKTDAGFCFRFNDNGSMVTNSAGMSGGVFFILNTQVEEYYMGPYSYSEGFSVSVHDKDDVPLMSELTYLAGTGSETNLMLRKYETIRVPPPADNNQSDCFDSENLPNPLRYFSQYTYSTCTVECRTDFVYRTCGCRYLLLPPLDDTPVCSLKLLVECSVPAMTEFSSNHTHLEQCDCKPICHDITYTATVSTLKYPSTNYAVLQKRTPAEIEEMKKNWAAIAIYYGEMSFQVVEETVAYTWMDMIANLGGTFGLCIGASLLTLAEFIEFGVLSLTNFLYKKKRIGNNKTAAAATRIQVISAEDKDY